MMARQPKDEGWVVIFKIAVTRQARLRLVERFPGERVAIQREVGATLARGRVSTRKPVGLNGGDHPETLYRWTEAQTRVYALRSSDDEFTVVTTMRANVAAPTSTRTRSDVCTRAPNRESESPEYIQDSSGACCPRSANHRRGVVQRRRAAHLVGAHAQGKVDAAVPPSWPYVVLGNFVLYLRDGDGDCAYHGHVCSGARQ